MSRIGNKAITIPSGVEVTVAEGNEVTVKGSKGTLTRKFSPLMNISIDGTTLTVSRPNEEKTTKQLHGTTRALLATMIEGCDTGVAEPGDVMVATFEQKMDLQGKDYLLSLGCTGFVNGEFVVFDRLYDVANLTVISDKNTVGYFDMNSQVTVERPVR